ncbi:receptor for retinol uptake stra6-like [Corythoichthys intestinalis]|uniref:receptor for retinol uptake stra6-like n=1 Tax=Corythoichthys intestinalis TaxID=161448 RepID=UPI0025A5F8BD|nr:receptor for retinol uptake stra6-like [Corythoichthys intestinalis]XP_061796102.1 receptor for retinol uptake stra6-like [Nerophis lumbriciformis]
MNHSKDEFEPFEYSYYDYADWYSNDPEPTKPPKEVISPCDPTASDAIFHICILSISLVIMLILATLSRKNKLCQGFARGSSSIFSPTNFLDQTQRKEVVMAVFGLVFSKLAVLVIAPDPLPFSKDTPPELKEFMKIIAIFYYPVLYYPLMLCSTLQLKAGYVFGTLLSVIHFGIQLWQKLDCPKTPELYKFYSLLASLPQLSCLAYLCIQFPLMFFRGTKTEQDLDSSYYSDYVKSLLKKSPVVSSSLSDKTTLMKRLLQVPKSYIYIPDKAFRFPLKLAVSVFVALVAIYHTALLLVVLVVPTLHIVRAGIDENIAFLLLGFGIILSDDRMEVVKIVTFYTWLLEVCYLCAMTLSCVVSLLMLMRTMVLHRSNLRRLYKGDIYNLYNSQKSLQPSRSSVVCWMGLTGYQAAIICLGMVIQTVVFFICFLFLVFLIIIPIFYGRNLMVFEIAGKAWPAWVSVILITVIQHVAARFAFVKKDAGTRDLNNRESLYLLTYLLFLINTVVGLIVAIWRIVITALFNIVHLGRADISLLHHTAEAYDPAYHYYTNFLKVEVSQAHPVMKAFCGLLLDLMVEDGRAGQKIRDAEEGIQENLKNRSTSSRRIRYRWQLVYTLVNNPSLLGSRKHFQTMQSLESILNGSPKRSKQMSSKREVGKASATVPNPSSEKQDKND